MKTWRSSLAAVEKQKLFYPAPVQGKLAGTCGGDELREPMCAVKAGVKWQDSQGQSSNRWAQFLALALPNISVTSVLCSHPYIKGKKMLTLKERLSARGANSTWHVAATSPSGIIDSRDLGYSTAGTVHRMESNRAGLCSYMGLKGFSVKSCMSLNQILAVESPLVARKRVLQYSQSA